MDDEEFTVDEFTEFDVVVPPLLLLLGVEDDVEEDALVWVFSTFLNEYLKIISQVSIYFSVIQRYTRRARFVTDFKVKLKFLF